MALTTGCTLAGLPAQIAAMARVAGAKALEAQAAGVHVAGAQGAVQHAEEWGTATMLHHVTDANSIDFGFFSVGLPQFPAFHVGPLLIDLSITRHVFFLFVACALTLITMTVAARQARRLEHGGQAPRGLLNALEALYLYLRDEVALANIGRGGEPFVPLVVTLFFFILYANLLGLLPFGATATSNIMVTAALAITSFAVIEVTGFRALGARGYLQTIFYLPPGLPVWMKPIMLVIMTPIEIIGKLAKPFALAIRLFANMTAGHFVLLSLLGLILTFGSFTHAAGLVAVIGPLLLGLFVMILEIFVALLQAYIFTILTAVFIGLIRHAH